MSLPPAFRHHLPAFLLPFLIFFLIAAAAAQDASTGSIRGTVSDPNGARIAGAHVLAVNSATGLTYSADTNSEGAFAFDLLPPGDYGVRADAPNMRSELRPAQHVPVGGAVQLDFRLIMAVVNEAVTVTEPPSLVEVQSSAVSGVIDEKAISDVPLNGRRFSDLALPPTTYSSIRPVRSPATLPVTTGKSVFLRKAARFRSPVLSRSSSPATCACSFLATCSNPSATPPPRSPKFTG